MKSIENYLPGVNRQTLQTLDNRIGLVVFKWGMVNTVAVGMAWFHKEKLVEIQGDIELLKRIAIELAGDDTMCDSLVKAYEPYLDGTFILAGITTDYWDEMSERSTDFIKCHPTQLVGVEYSAENFSNYYRMAVLAK